jgi:hypothetical protein
MFYNIGPLNIISIQILSSQNKRRKKLELRLKDRKFYGQGAVFTKLFFISTNELNKLDRLQEEPEETSFIPPELYNPFGKDHESKTESLCTTSSNLRAQ